ncbi:hypothetical protein Gogos_004479 [Gossypium gossypioides]|uniref:UBN2 domain-containing protein n=1 Tax=Gossypium gossypioides TaxID=34282 RepID=A0A7J9CGD6_GOSGO|nr:hypothetical protein [Gossypium gossypioides]
MSDRFTHIINGIKALRKTYPNMDMVKKVLNSLPTSWEAKVTVIEESKDLNSLSLDELIGSLLTHEMRLNKESEKEKVMKKNVGKALKSTTNDDSESSEEVDEDKEMEIFARRFKRFMKPNKGR